MKLGKISQPKKLIIHLPPSITPVPTLFQTDTQALIKLEPQKYVYKV